MCKKKILLCILIIIFIVFFIKFKFFHFFIAIFIIYIMSDGFYLKNLDFKIINLKDNTNFSAKSRKIEIDFIGQEFSFIEKFELFLKNNDIGYKIEKKKFIISNSKEEIIKKIYYYFGSNDMNVHPSNFRISDMSVDDII